MKKRTSLLFAVIAAFLAGRAVQAGSFVDTIGAGDAANGGYVAGPSDGGVLSSAIEEGEMTPQQKQYQQYLNNLSAKRQALEQENIQKYEDRKAKAEAENEALREQQAGGPSVQEADAAPPDTTPVLDAPPQPRRGAEDDSALNHPYRQKLGYPYTSE